MKSTISLFTVISRYISYLKLCFAYFCIYKDIFIRVCISLDTERVEEHDEERLHWNSAASYLFCSAAVSVSPLKCSSVASCHSSGFELVRVGMCVCVCLFMGECSQCAWCLCVLLIFLLITCSSYYEWRWYLLSIKRLPFMTSNVWYYWSVSILDGAHSVWKCERSLAPRESESALLFTHRATLALIQTPER